MARTCSNSSADAARWPSGATRWACLRLPVGEALLAAAGHPLLSRLIEALTDTTLGLSLVVADCLQTLVKRDLRLKPDLEARFRAYSLSAIDRAGPIRARIDLGDALGYLGDPRSSRRHLRTG